MGNGNFKAQRENGETKIFTLNEEASAWAAGEEGTRARRHPPPSGSLPSPMSMRGGSPRHV